MKTTPDELMFLAEDEAQALLDKQDPGYRIATAESGLAVVIDDKNALALVVEPTND